MTHCKDCKFFLKHGPGAEWGDCMKLKDCDLFELYIPYADINYDKIDIETHPNFGCVLGEEKV